MKTNITIVFLAACNFILGCAGEEMQSVELDSNSYNLSSPDAQALAGGKTISRRGENFGLAAGKLARPKFASYTDSTAKSRLNQGLGAVLGVTADASQVVDDGGELRSTHGNGFAIAAKGSGALVVKKLGTPRRPTSIENAEEAVNLALEGVSKSGLLTLAKNETLDVVGVTSTHYAGWIDNGGEDLEPVYFSDESSTDPVTEFKSDYTVYFGRRYRGVPIIGPTLGVRLDANGEMVAFMKGWRDIKGETAPVAVKASANAVSHAAEVSAVADEAFEVKGAACGFTEGHDLSQTAAGIGCAIKYANLDEVDGLASEKVEWTNLASDESIALGVESASEAAESESTDPSENESPAPVDGNDISE